MYLCLLKGGKTRHTNWDVFSVLFFPFSSLKPLWDHSDTCAVFFFSSGVLRVFLWGFQTHTNTNKRPKVLSSFMHFFSSDLTSQAHSACLSPLPPLSLHLFVPITTKPRHHGSCGHVNQPGQHHLFPAVYLQPNKGVCLFVVAGVECCVGWGLLFNSTRCYQPPLSEKANSTRGINGRGEETRREDVNVGVVGHLETISNPSFPEEQRQTGHNGGASQANVKSK